jgi:hypothetical protein
MFRTLFFKDGPITRRLKFENWRLGASLHPRRWYVGLHWMTMGHTLDVFVFPLPCVMVHLSFEWHDPEQ